jgi:hypothetical protein
VGCSEVLGIESLPTAAFDYAASACSDCIGASCAVEEATCAGDEGCAALYACLAACAPDDLACRGGCEQGHPEGLFGRTAADLESCRRHACLEPCVGVDGLWRPVVDQPCDECLDSKCAEANLACLADYRCARTVRCGQGCTEPDCLLDCIDRFDANASPATHQMANCASSCHAVCSFGTDWSCVGQYSWSTPDPERSTVPIAFGVADATLNAAAGLTVTAYPTGAPPFDEPLDAAQTDGSGIARVTVPVLPLGFVGALIVTGSIRDESVYPNLFFFGRPVVRPLSTSTIVATGEDIADVETLLAELDPPVTLGPGLAHVQVYALDCTMKPAPGLILDVDAGARTPSTADFYLTGESTDRTGAGFVFNVEPGWVTVSARLAEGGETVAEHLIWAEPDTGSIVVLWPTPS